MGLQRYKQKRNFVRTPEPAGRVGKRKTAAPMFVIQKHDATRLHYDFRLKMEGVLKSWAVPKGIPTTKGEKRLAAHVEDHPLDYGDFEGIIPEGNYGAGTVMVWDTGTWEPRESNPAKGLEAGKIKFTLHGKKLEGEWTLVRMKSRGQQGGKDEWLLIKTGEDIKPISAKKDDESVLTHRTMKQIAAQQTRSWKSNREPSGHKNSFKQRIAAATRSAALDDGSKMTLSRARRKPEQKPARSASAEPNRVPIMGDAALQNCPNERPHFVEPMKARIVASLPAQGDWLLEVKHDGFRCIALKDDSSVELFSRSRRNMTADFSEIARAIAALPPKQLVLDGEIVALDEHGRGSFQLLQNHRTHERERGAIVFYVFDLLHFAGKDLKQLPLTARRELLQPIITGAADTMRVSATLDGAPDVVLSEVKRMGLEGVIAKKPNSKYEAGLRSGSWVKVKCVHEQEFVIGGYTLPQGSRDFFGALLVGYYQDGRLMFASKAGTGYTQATLRDLFNKFKTLGRADCPFVNLPTKRSGKFGQGVTASEMRTCTWLEPQLVAQIKFTEWTGDGGLRHPVFLGLRDDKKASDVRKEVAE